MKLTLVLFLLSSPAFGMQLWVQKGCFQSGNKIFLKPHFGCYHKKQHTYDGFRIEDVVKEKTPLNLIEQYNTEENRLLNEKGGMQQVMKMAGTVYAVEGAGGFVVDIEWLSAMGTIGVLLTAMTYVPYTLFKDKELTELKSEYKDKIKAHLTYLRLPAMAAAWKEKKEENKTRLQLTNMLAEIAEEY